MLRRFFQNTFSAVKSFFTSPSAGTAVKATFERTISPESTGKIRHPFRAPTHATINSRLSLTNSLELSTTLALPPRMPATSTRITSNFHVADQTSGFHTMTGPHQPQLCPKLTEVVGNLDPVDAANMAAQKQKAGGYNVDKWENTTLGQVGKSLLVQSFVPGNNLFANTATLTLEQVQEHTTQIQTGKLNISSSSNFYAYPSAFARTNLINPHYHCYIQAGVKHCSITGQAKHRHRENLALVHIPQELKDLPVAIATAEANSVRMIAFGENGTKVEYIGQGGETQIFIPETVSYRAHASQNGLSHTELHTAPIMRHLWFREIHQQSEGRYGVSYKEIQDGMVIWSFKGAVNTPNEIFHLPAEPESAAKEKLDPISQQVMENSMPRVRR